MTLTVQSSFSVYEIRGNYSILFCLDVTRSVILCDLLLERIVSYRNNVLLPRKVFILRISHYSTICITSIVIKSAVHIVKN